MKIRKQDLAVLFFYYLGYSKARNIYLRRANSAVSRFVTFHDLKPAALGCFKENLHFLKRSTNVVSLDDYLSGRLSQQKINVVITFDDGYKSWVIDALPILEEMELPATFFVSSGYLGFSEINENETRRSERPSKHEDSLKLSGCMLRSDVRKLAEAGYTIGGHTVNHVNMTEIRDRDQLLYEIVEDKARLESITGGKIEYFAYPSGAYQNPEIDLVPLLKEAGYKGAVTTVSGFNRIGTNPYMLRRELTDTTMPGSVFRARVYGNYDAILFIKRKYRAILQKR